VRVADLPGRMRSRPPRRPTRLALADADRPPESVWPPSMDIVAVMIGFPSSLLPVWRVAVAFAIPLGRDHVGTSAPPQIRRYDIFPAILPGTDEMLKLRNGPWLFQVLNYAIDPAQEPPPVVHQQIWSCGHPSLRMTHHPFCLANLPLNV
jgi:hypothetical protein